MIAPFAFIQGLLGCDAIGDVLVDELGLRAAVPDDGLAEDLEVPDSAVGTNDTDRIAVRDRFASLPLFLSCPVFGVAFRGVAFDEGDGVEILNVRITVHFQQCLVGIQGYVLDGVNAYAQR